MRGKCKWCGRHFNQGGVCPSSWGWVRRNGAAHRGYDSNDIYCSEKCRAEAEAGSSESNNDDSSPSSDGGSFSTSSPSEPMLSPGCSAVLGKLVTGVLILLGLIVIYAMIFGPKEENVNDKEQMMELWGEHLEKRCAAFAEGLSEESVEARGLKNYTWDEWMDFKRNGQKVAATQSTKPSEPSLRDQWLAHMDKRSKMSASGMATTEIDKAGYPNLTFDEFKEFKKKKAEEAELKRLNARLEELEGASKTADMARNSCSCEVQFSGDERIVTVTSEYGTRTSAWQEAVRAAVETAVLNFVSDSKLLRTNQSKLKDRLNSVDKTDIKKLDVLIDKQVGNVFTVKIRACFDKKSLALKFKDIFPNTFAAVESTGKGTVSEQQNSASGCATKDSKGIRTTVQGKGKTKEAALKNVFRQAVWKTVNTWVDSKSRIEANRKEVIAIVETVTEADVGKYEVTSTEQQDGAFVVNAKVSVSKQKIAPKFAKLFPDVFANEVKGK